MLPIGAGCLPVRTSDFEDAAIPESCGNGVCEIMERKNCRSCPQDCSCCHAVYAAGAGIENPENALGPPDGKYTVLNSGGVLELTLGQEFYDEPGDDPGCTLHADFELLGQATGAPPLSKQCPVITQLEGAVLVKVEDRGEWKIVGVWAESATEGSDLPVNHFDLACGSTRKTFQVRLEAQQEARAEIDSIHALGCTP